MVLLPPSPSPATIARRLRFLASRLRWPQYRAIIWAMVTPEEWSSLAIPKGKQPDPIVVWARIRELSLVIAVIDLAQRVELINETAYKCLLRAIHANDDLSVGEPADSPNQKSRPDDRKMVSSQLQGKHMHETRSGVKVHIYERQGRFIARGSMDNRPFGQTLGESEVEAESKLRDMLVSIDRSTFIRPSDAKHLHVNEQTIPRLTITELCNRFLMSKRAIKGKGTASTYRSRLNPLIEFGDRPEVLRRWTHSDQVNSAFAIEYRKLLFAHTTTRNGHVAADEIAMSPKQIQNCLETARTMFNWATEPQNGCLRPSFANPFTRELIGPKIKKDPLQENPLPMAHRIAMVRVMDEWELSVLALSMTLPPRPEEIEGLLISDVNLTKRELHFGDHLDGRDFNKGRLAFTIPIPEQLLPVIRHNIAGRGEGPLLRRREIITGRRRAKLTAECIDDVARHFAEFQRRARPNEIQNDQDLKRLFHRLLRNMGGVNVARLRNAFKSARTRAGIVGKCRFYDTRAAVTDEMRDAGVADMELRYLTGHAVNDVLVNYTGLKPHAEMVKYFKASEPLLSAIAVRAKELGI